jgi:hypothetical protein
VVEQHLMAVLGAPVVCDLTAPPETGEGVGEYGQLFAEHLVGRERTGEGVRWRFRAGDGVQAWVQRMTEREHACCPFFTFHVTQVGDEIHWDSSVIDDDLARVVLEEFYNMPETLAVEGGAAAMEQRLTGQGFQIITRD